jgi:hypothetical protein
MPHTTTLPRASGQPRSAPAVRGRTLDERLALRWGCQPATAHRIRCDERAPVRRVEDELDERLAVGDIAGAMELVRGILQRINAADALPTAAELDKLEERADLEEDLAQEAWRHDRSPVNAARLRRASGAHRFHAERRDAALARLVP